MLTSINAAKGWLRWKKAVIIRPAVAIGLRGIEGITAEGVAETGLQARI